MDSLPYAKAGSATEPATLLDPPGGPATARDWGWEFYTVAICENDTGKAVPIGWVHWGLYVDKEGRVAFNPVKPDVGRDAPPPLEAAVGRWNSIKGNTKLDLDIGR
jgi:hypothetical protein